MQWPPTRPGRKAWKFHLVPAAASTSLVSSPSSLKIMRQLVDQGDIDVALDVLDDLGGLGDPDRARPMGAGGHDAAIDLVDEVGGLGVEPEVTLTMLGGDAADRRD